MSRMKRWLALWTAVLLVTALAVSGAHVHRGPVDETGCVASTLAHAPAPVAAAAPAVRAPEPTHEVVRATPLEVFAAPLCAVPASRAPPLG
jgi:hypothetical protein